MGWAFRRLMEEDRPDPTHEELSALPPEWRSLAMVVAAASPEKRAGAFGEVAAGLPDGGGWLTLAMARVDPAGLAPIVAPPTKAAAMADVPRELKDRRRWLLWRLVADEGKAKPRKVPYMVDGETPGKWGDPGEYARNLERLTTFDVAFAALESGGYAGVGFAFTPDDPYCGVDLDGCLDASGAVSPKAAAWLARFEGAYVEASPSGTGLHAICRARLVGGGVKGDGFEVYDRGRYFTVTGRAFAPTPTTIPDRQAAVDDLVAAIRAEKRKANGKAEPPPNGDAGWSIPVKAPTADPIAAHAAEALRREAAELTSTPEGGRNHRLNASAFSLGQLVRAGSLSRYEVETALTVAARQCGLGDVEIEKTLRSGIEAGMATPRDLSRVGTAEKRRNGRAANGKPGVDTKDGKPGAGTTDGGRGIVYRDLGLIRVSDIKTVRTEWIWRHRFPAGEISLVAGEGSLGKSQFLTAMAAAMSVGGPWPDGSGDAPIVSTIILAAEDSAEKTIRPRLLAVGADVSKVLILKAQYTFVGAGGRDVAAPVNFQDHDHWKAVFDAEPEARVLIVDPLASYLGRGVDDHRNNELRAVLEPFMEFVARPRGIAVVGNAHLNKTADARTPIYRVMGSAGYANLARAVHLVVRDPDDPAHRVVSLAKSNLGPDDLPAIGYRIEPRTIAGDGIETETCVPAFDPEPIHDFDLRAALAPAKGTAGAPKNDPAECDGWLRFRLESGPVPSNEIFKEGRAAGFTRDQLYDAKKRIKAGAKRDGFGPGGQWSWELPPAAVTWEAP